MILIGGLFAGIQYVKRNVVALDERVASASTAEEQALQSGDIESLKSAVEQREQITRELREIRQTTLLLMMLTLCCAPMILWGTWDVTAAPRTGMEQATRWIVLALPFAFAVAVAGGGPGPWKLLFKGMSLIVTIGQQHAFTKICELTGQYQLGQRISRIYMGLFFGIAGLIGLVFLLEWLGIREALVSPMIGLTLFYFGGLVLLLAYSLLELRNGCE